jgi:protein dithiol oxidoreductase (disulfide-forming)
MKRHFLLRSRFAILVGLLLALSTAYAQPVADKDYRMLPSPQPTADPKKIEVIEFFSYSCPHCAEFEPHLQNWLKRKPKDVEFKEVPMVFGRDNWKATAKLYYALEALGVVDKYQGKVYDAIHKQSKDLGSDASVKQWAKDAGIDPAKFEQVYDSFGIDAKVQRSTVIGRTYGVQFTPSMAINGKYYTGPSMGAPQGAPPDYDRFFKNVDELIDMERKARKK